MVGNEGRTIRGRKAVDGFEGQSREFVLAANVET